MEIIRRIQDALPHGEHSQIAPLYPTWEAATRIYDALRLYFDPPFSGAALEAGPQGDTQRQEWERTAWQAGAASQFALSKKAIDRLEAEIATLRGQAGPSRTEIARRIQETRDLAYQDHASGHLTDFWYARVNALCDMVALGEAGPSPREPERIRNPRIKTREDVIEEGIRASDDVFADGMEREDAFRLGIGVALSLWEDILGVRGECVPPLQKQPASMNLQPLIARIRQQLGGGDRVTATPEELAQFVAQIIDLTLAEVDRTEIAPRHSGNDLGGPSRGEVP